MIHLLPSFVPLLTFLLQSCLQAWLDSIPPADQPVFWTQQYEDVVELGDTLVLFLTSHYSADGVTRLFLREPYPTPLPPIPSLSEPPPPEPLFLPDLDPVDPPPQTAPAKPAPPKKTQGSSHRTPDPPKPRTLAAELEAEAAFQATARECEAQQLDELIWNNTDPTGRGRHASAKEKRAALSATSKSLL